MVLRCFYIKTRYLLPLAVVIILLTLRVQDVKRHFLLRYSQFLSPDYDDHQTTQLTMFEGRLFFGDQTPKGILPLTTKRKLKWERFDFDYVDQLGVFSTGNQSPRRVGALRGPEDVVGTSRRQEDVVGALPDSELAVADKEEMEQFFADNYQLYLLDGVDCGRLMVARDRVLEESIQRKTSRKHLGWDLELEQNIKSESFSCTRFVRWVLR